MCLIFYLARYQLKLIYKSKFTLQTKDYSSSHTHITVSHFYLIIAIHKYYLYKLTGSLYISIHA